MTDLLKVGELAKRTGLSVRTLHHYDEIGLLRPAARTRAGHRLYGLDEARRLQLIASLRRLGLSLADIAGVLRRPNVSLEGVLDVHIRRVRAEIREQERLCGLLERLRDGLVEGSTTLDDLTGAVEATLRHRQYFTAEELERLERRRAEVGDDAIRDAEAEWRTLLEGFRTALREGRAPDAPEVRALAGRAAELVRAFTGDDPGIAAATARMYREEGAEAVLAPHGMDVSGGVWDYMGRAMAALRGEDGAPRD